MSKPANSSEQSPTVDESMATLMRKVEMQHLQLQLEARFRKNMEVFKELSPEIYHQFTDYQPEELRLSYDKDGYLELVNFKLNNKPVYGSDPVEFCRKQVKDFVKNPSATTISIAQAKINNEAHIHVKFMNRLREETLPFLDGLKMHCDAPIGLMLMTGCGLGYQIHELLERTEIHNLIIFDPHKDSFYAALHVVDWLPILQYFCQRGRMLKFLIGVNPRDAMANMRLLTDKIGLHNIVYTYVYRHFSSKEEQEFIDLYRKEFQFNASGTGFFDDEQVSLAHTVTNLNNRTPVFRYDKNLENLPPAIIVGNGPSLDDHVAFMKDALPNAVLFSCGTALGALARNNIKPDFHVEMERNYNIVTWIKRGSTEEFRKGVSLLCLNTAAPDAIDIFDEACMARKPNDLGEVFFDEIKEKNPISSLQLCNPTVTNAATTYALAMGFREIYLIGVDLGNRPDGEHHSKYSLYKDIENKASEKGKKIFDYTSNQYKIKGNFTDEVFTSHFLDITRINLEILFRYYNLSKGKVNCYNPNQGAYIEGATPTKAEDLIRPAPLENKAEIIKSLKALHFHTPELETISEDEVREKYLKSFFSIKKSLALPKKIKNHRQLYDTLNEIYLRVSQLEGIDRSAKMLLRGSMNGYFTLIVKAAHLTKKQEDFIKIYQLGRKAYTEFMDKAFMLMKENPLKLDDSYDKLVVTLDDNKNSATNDATSKADTNAADTTTTKK
ncbi:hypothetical protein TDB9533_02082 [Thalassocella blandensis]|nr:hypothetical protein TDB9533_02082 [Thalassocella blandensis]